MICQLSVGLVRQFELIVTCRYIYQLTGKGRWNSLALKKPKPQSGKKAGKKQQQQPQKGRKTEISDEEDRNDDDEVCSTYSYVLWNSVLLKFLCSSALLQYHPQLTKQRSLHQLRRHNHKVGMPLIPKTHS